ncbi:MAG: type II toxin-antitoxin system YafQ family toxin [Kiritimatiellae bacterium]|nr:type II toxin-antitoxin system YafQ family toxin [Kiritimatiellia bacterium]MDD3543918.1 type II toxin-antitoxin system YafQ family toxin [Kiritimatiellia bacterium]MDD4024566.1 type II toxin-antitoxin system YafQ family toxin [Kiritimatiellia bacterium]MDD4622117.1 type II toxin-antitoxin system YafQ family toxin [Kiritimatiellia bacterium]
MKRVSQTKQFHRDVKRMRKRGKDLSKLQALVRLLAHGSPLSPRHCDHPLLGAWAPSRDCHVEPDWILVYTPGIDTLLLERTGTHADLFGK